MPTCSVCGVYFSSYARINGVSKNLGNRVRCLSCLPWGAPRYPPRTEDEKIQANRAKVRRYYVKMTAKLGVNPVTARNRRRKLALVNAVGGKCCICGYSAWVGNLSFHHYKDKKQLLSSDNLDHSAKRIINELKACILVCHNCHGEIHHKGLSINAAYNAFQQKVTLLEDKSWKDILRLGIEPSTQCL